MMAAEEGGGGGAEVAAEDDTSDGVVEGAWLMGQLCDLSVYETQSTFEDVQCVSQCISSRGGGGDSVSRLSL
jgi:hypothetical protein